MYSVQNSKPFRHFARHVFLVGNTYFGRNEAKDDVDGQLHKMRKSIIKMRLSYTDIDTLKEKIENLLVHERKYAKLFRPKDKEMEELKENVEFLEQELKNEREEKQRIISENNEKIRQFTDSLDNIKNQVKHLHLEKAKRHHRLKALEQKIREKVDVNRFYTHSHN